MRRLRTVAALALVPAPVLAHESGGAAADPWRLPVALLVAAAATVYVAGAGALRRRTGPERRGIARSRLLAGAAGFGVLAVAELSPLDGAAAVLFSAHMTQHEMVMLVAAPLLVLGRPLWVALWALPDGARRRVGAVLRGRRVRAVWRAASAPFVVFALHAIVLSAWHVPRLFDAALERDGIHVVQHATFLATATLFWWGLLEGRYGRASYGIAVLYVFATAVHRTLLGALVTVSARPWYAVHAERTALAGGDPLRDQQLAGLVMWVPFGILLAGIALALAAAWIAESERRARVPIAHRGLAAILVALAIAAGGCRGAAEERAAWLTGGDPDRGRELVRDYGCGACHVVPGVRGAAGVVGPTLARIGARTHLVGTLVNQPSNLVRWIRDPQSIEPGTLMPDLDVDERDARDLAAYLYSLR